MKSDPEPAGPPSPHFEPTGTLSPSGPAPSVEPGPVFAAGVTLAGRFLIRRFLAHGGMGEVYEAEDLELGERVALKTIRSEVASDARALARFRSEIHLAHRVTHPNACRVFDVFHHPAGGASGVDALFLTMEFLEGETLAERLARAGAWTPAQALPIVEHMAAALEAAHQAGVVHRDFKSANVMLVPDAGGTGVRAVDTDFGLARPAGDERAWAELTHSAELMGTPAYMAPEQIEGLPATPRTDVYALGVVLYELVTGSRPFGGDTPLAAMVKRLKQQPPSPRTLAPGLDRRWEAVILRCLEREPQARFASAADVARALRGLRVRGSARRRWLVPGVCAALGIIALLLWNRRPPDPAPASGAAPAAAAVKTRRSVAVLGFKNLARRAEAAWLSTALAELLSCELAAGEHLRVVAGENVARTRQDLALGELDSLAADTLARVRQQLGSDLVVSGSYTALGSAAGGQIRVDVRLQDALAGETVATVSESGTEAELFGLISRTGERLRARLGVGGVSSAQAAAVRTALPADPGAARLYAEGLDRLRRLDARSARELLSRAVAADPHHGPSQAALAGALQQLGQDAQARAAAKRAFELSSELPREQRLVAEARYSETSHEWQRAIAIYSSLLEFFPDNLDYGLGLAAARTSGGQAKDALALLASLRRLPTPAGADPAIDLAEALAARNLADWKLAVAAARRAVTKGRQSGARLVVARARFDEGSALHNLGELDAAREALEEARRLYSEAGDRRGQASALNNLALILMARGELEAAQPMFEEALELYRGLGHRSGQALMMGNLGNLRYFRRDLPGARRRWDEARASYEALNEPEGAARMHVNVASALAEEGRLDEARDRFELGITAYRQVGDRQGLGAALGDLGKLRAQQGDLSGARGALEEALRIWKETGDKLYAPSTLHDLGNLAREIGEAGAARQRYEEALAMRGSVQDPAAVLDRLALAELALDAGQAEQAERAAREALLEPKLSAVPEAATLAHDLQARALLALGRVEPAQAAAARAVGAAGAGQPQATRIAVDVTAARILARTQPAEAARRLTALAERAGRAGLMPCALETRLALAQLELSRGLAESGGARLRAVATQARTAGLLRLARQAQTDRQATRQPD